MDPSWCWEVPNDESRWTVKTEPAEIPAEQFESVVGHVYFVVQTVLVRDWWEVLESESHSYSVVTDC